MSLQSPSAVPAPLANHNGWPWSESPLTLSDPLPDGALWPRISIVTPSFNQAQYLEAAIRSVLLQGYPNLEFIVMDGGSTDGSMDIIRHYGKLIDFWVSEPDAGQSDAISQGFSRANGSILGWLNSDDLLLPGALSAVALAFHKSPGMGLFYGGAEIIDAEGHFVRTYNDFRPYDYEVLLHDDNIIPQPSAFFSTEIWRECGPLRVDLHYVMDWDLWIRIARNHEVNCTSTALSQVRIYPQAKSASGGLDRHIETRDMLLAHGSHAARIHYKIGLWYYQRDQMKEARPYFVEGLRRSPSPQVRRYLIGLLVKSLLGSHLVDLGRSLRSRSPGGRNRVRRL
jgi:glycosyltransferase involved in cell wall biosynthesis